jgi:hypothetical protein
MRVPQLQTTPRGRQTPSISQLTKLGPWKESKFGVMHVPWKLKKWGQNSYVHNALWVVS